MTKRLNDGGPAFPIQESIISQGSEGVPASAGMSLRDYFAAKAMQGIVEAQVSRSGGEVGERRVAVDAYRIADAMLKAREL